MAGNIVKWWKHKILGGYKQFSVLQECTTDSEELIYPVRAPSSCSAPPDLLMVNDHETIQMKQSVNLTTTKNQNHNKNHHHHGKSRGTTKSHPIENHHPSDNIENQRKNDNNDRIQLEEFTCDVSVEAGKSSQPLQFSFTFYDLDGHHGKITKDDIAGIVYTIYESIGKSVVVPHCGSKTINVRLTVSPEGKTKTSSSNKMKKLNSTINQTSSTAGVGIGVGVSGRRHRYRPRKLVKSDDDEDDIDSGSDKEITFINNKKGPTTSKYHHHHNQQQQQQQHRINPELAANVLDNNSQQHTPNKFPTGSENVYESVGNLKYYSKDPSRKVDIIECKECIQGSMVQPIGDNHHTQQQILKQSSTRAKLLRRARKQKYHEHYIESRQRSLSVGNETSWKLRAAARAAIVATRKTRPTDEIDGNLTQSPIITAGTSPTTTTTNECWNNALKRNDLIDIIRESMEKNRLCFQSNGKPQINGSPVHHRQRSNTTSKIIDEKYHQSRQQQQSPQTSHHIPIYHQQLAINPIILQKNQNNKTNLCGYDSYLHAKICTPTAATATTATTTAAQTTTTSCIPINNVQNQVPIQQTSSSKLITTTTTTINSPKIYVNSNNLITTTPTTRCNKLQRNIIVGNNSNGILLNGYHSQQNSPQFHGYQRLNSSQKQQQQHIKLKTTILNSLNPQLTAEEKLSRTIDHVEKWLNEREQEHQQTMMYKVNDLKLIKYAIRNNNNNSINDNKIDIIDNNSKCKKDEKNYDNLLYSKLNEKLQQKHIKTPTRKMTNNNTNNINNNINNNSNNNNNNNKENTRPHHHHQHHHRRRSNSSTSNSKLITLINVVDPLECENLLHQTSDDDITISPIITKTITTKTTTTKNSDNNDEINIIVEDDVNGSDHQNDANNCNNSNGNTSSTTTNSSMIQHRYVHEHIHHHYHHFENNE